MKEYYRKSEVIIGGLSIILTTFVDQAYTLIELNSVETSEDAEGIEHVHILEGGASAALDYYELDEIIALLQETSDVLKRSEKRE